MYVRLSILHPFTTAVVKVKATENDETLRRRIEDALKAKEHRKFAAKADGRYEIQVLRR